MANIYEPLLWINPPGSAEQFTPALATEWERSDDGLTWTFQLRTDVTFHDGEPLTADAVVASSRRPGRAPVPRSSGCRWTRSPRPIP